MKRFGAFERMEFHWVIVSARLGSDWIGLDWIGFGNFPLFTSI